MPNGRALLHTLRYFVGLDQAQTQTTERERRTLCNYARGKARVAEIGVFEGYSTRLLAQELAPDGTLYGIDPCVRGRLGVCWTKLIAQHEIGRARPRRKVVLCEKYSYEAAALIEGEFDLVFIDGDHSVEGITRDWADWSGRVRVGGIMALHDTRVPEHNAAVADLGSYRYFESHIRFDPRYRLLEQIDSLSVLRRA